MLGDSGSVGAGPGPGNLVEPACVPGDSAAGGPREGSEGRGAAPSELRAPGWWKDRTQGRRAEKEEGSPSGSRWDGPGWTRTEAPRAERKGQGRAGTELGSHLALGQRGQGRGLTHDPIANSILLHQGFIEHLVTCQVPGTQTWKAWPCPRGVCSLEEGMGCVT